MKKVLLVLGLFTSHKFP